MAVAFDAAAALGFTGSNATTATLAHTISGANTILVVYVTSGIHASADYISGITWNGTALVRTKFKHFTGANYQHDLWYLRAAETGSHNIVVTNSTDQRNGIVSMSFTGAAQSAAAQPNGSHKSGSGATTSHTHTATSTIDDCLLVGGMTPEYDRGDMSAASGSTIRAASGTFARGITADGVLASAGSDTLAATATNTAWGALSLWVAPVEADPAPPSDIEKLNGIAVANIEAVN
jgi:hypothetical protein|tara:strand:- start:617 stop:1321 length:705 start_codon:yes stop_codon:yes gene_type:complete